MAWILRNKIVRKIPVGSGTIPNQDTGWVPMGNCTYQRIKIGDVQTATVCNEELGVPASHEDCCCYCVTVWKRTLNSSSSTN